MRSVGHGLALVASVQFTVLPAFAADLSQPPAKVAAAKKKKKPAKGTSVVVHTTAGEVPAAPPATTPAPADVPPATAAPVVPAPATTPTPAPALEAPPAAATPAPPPPPANPPGTVTVHINSPKVVALEKRTDSGAPWEHVCNSPCDVPTSTNDQYQIVGIDLNGSRPFVLDSSLGDKITLDVQPGIHNKGARGGWLLAGGIVLAVGGLVTIVAGSRNTAVPGDSGANFSTQNTDFIFVGSALITAGIVLGITGGSFMYDNAHTRVEGAVGAVPDGKTEVKTQVQVTAQRLPQWHEDTGPQLAQSRYVSLFQGSF